MSLLRQSAQSALRLASKKSTSSCSIILKNSIRFNSTENSTPVDPKITAIVSEISKLTLLETSVLISELKTALNITEIAFPTGGAAPAAAPAAAVEEEVQEEVQEKTLFNVKLESFDAKSKPKIIKEVKSLLGLSLVESKKFVESAPKTLKENLPKEDAEKMQQVLEGLGAKIVLE